MNSQDFVRKLISFCDMVDQGDLGVFSEQIMREFLRMGSETEDNLNSYHHIEYGLVENRSFGPKNVYGLKVKGKNILVSDVMSDLESIDIPGEIEKYYPELAPEEWAAIRRVATMILIAVDCVMKTQSPTDDVM